MGEGGKRVSLFKAGKWTNSNKRTEAFATEKDEKTLKNTVNGMWSTCLLVKIHNIC